MNRKCSYCGKEAPSEATKMFHKLKHGKRANHLLHTILRLFCGEGVRSKVMPEDEYWNEIIYLISKELDRASWYLENEDAL